jgi:hypothetical protein
VRLGSKQFPQYAVRTNFEAGTEDYIRALNDLVSISRPYSDMSSGGIIDLENYANLFPIFAIDTSASDEELFSAGSTQELSVDITLASEAGENYHLWCITETERKAKLTVMDQRMSLVRA